MTKSVLLAAVFQLALAMVPLSAYASANPAKAASAEAEGQCRQERDGVSLRLAGRQLGFSSLEACERQLEFIDQAPDGAVICGCKTEASLLNLLGLLVGVTQIGLGLECHEFQGRQLRRVKYVAFEPLRETEPNKPDVYRPEVMQRCQLLEGDWFARLNDERVWAQRPRNADAAASRH